MKNKGIIPINKAKDWTSFDVVNKLKYKLKPLKAGHLGTLDPMATGVLLVTVGKATKLFDIMQEKRKTYIATFEFGYQTDTLDSTGKTIDYCDTIPTEEEINLILPKFIGKISQIPPKYSAKSVNGSRAYDLARQGIDFKLKAKEVEIYSITILSYSNKILKLEIECGSGTYIRSIGRDIAKELNSMATMIDLVRTKVGEITIDRCFNISEIEEIEEKILPIQDFLNYEILDITNEQKSKLLNGQTIVIDKTDGLYKLNEDYDTIALVQINGNKAKMSLFLG